MRDRKDLAADMAWQVVTPREGLPGPGDMMQLPDEDEAVVPFRHWVDTDYAEPDRGPMRWDGLAIVFGLCLGFWVAAGLAAWKFWPAIEGAFQ